MEGTALEAKNENDLSQPPELQDTKLSLSSTNLLGWLFYTATGNWTIYYRDTLVTCFIFHFFSALRQHINLAVLKCYFFQVLRCGLEFYFHEWKQQPEKDNAT